MLYDAVYHPSCSRALVASFKERSYPEREARNEADVQEDFIKRHLAVYHTEMDSHGKTAVEVHQGNVGAMGIPWLELQSNHSCLLCLRRKTENPLSCGHTICNVCVRIFGDEMPLVECQYRVGTCLLCRLGTCMVRLKPPSAGERLLALDGGGTRGVILLDILAIMQNMLGNEVYIQDLFDVAFGTSVGKPPILIFRRAQLTSDTGGLIACILFLRGMPVSRCVHVFDTLARRLFGRP